MREAVLYERRVNGSVRCNVCQRRCIVAPGKRGVCKTRLNDGGALFTLIYGKVSSAAVDPIEKKPLYHFHPGTRVFSLGTLGCNFHCKHCQNWQISFAQPEVSGRDVQELAPAAAIEATKRYGCGGIAWTYNEPGIWLEYALDCAKLAKAQGLYTAYVTNGYLTPEALDLIGPYLDAYRVDVKGWSDSAYRRLAHVPAAGGILAVAKRARQKWNMHVEVVTNVIPGLNDADSDFAGIAAWIAKDLGELTPWHVTRFYPHYELSHLPPTPVQTIEKGCEIGRQAGLRFVYVGNVPGHQSENTVCHQCGRLLIQRLGYSARVVGIEGGQCSRCGADVNIWQQFRGTTHEAS
ncbi:MAG: AmmeMemoRadiSam system radical SAM enzyme [Chloroflexi bacterium]|nr:AmmeMemoRadiSam system radical SAM enzyme [Chloroflexota bacterium]